MCVARGRHRCLFVACRRRAYGIEIRFGANFDAHGSFLAVAAASAFTPSAPRSSARSLVRARRHPTVDGSVSSPARCCRRRLRSRCAAVRLGGRAAEYAPATSRRLGRAAGAGVLLALLAWAVTPLSGSWINVRPVLFCRRLAPRGLTRSGYSALRCWIRTAALLLRLRRRRRPVCSRRSA